MFINKYIYFVNMKLAHQLAFNKFLIKVYYLKKMYFRVSCASKGCQRLFDDISRETQSGKAESRGD